MGNSSTILRAGKGELPRQLEAVARLVADVEAAESLRQVFSFLLGMMESLPPLEAASVLTQDKALTSLASVKEDAFSLADHIDSVTRQQAEGDALTEALAGVGFALRHEAGRVSGLYAAEEGVGAELLHDLSLLSNCLRQSVVMLARAVDPAAEMNDLLDEESRRLRESVALRDGLLRLIDALKNPQSHRYPQSAVCSFAKVEEFRSDFLPYLMRRDWPTFEGFADEIVLARDQKEFDAISGRFVTYLETLLRHVQMRAALNGQPAAQPEPPAGVWQLLRRVARPPMLWSAAMSALVIACCVFLTRASGNERPTPAADSTEQQQAVATAQEPSTANAATRAAAKATAGTDARWSLQLGAYGDRRKAEELAARLRAGRVEARVVESGGGGQEQLYRVRAGSFRSREAADSAGRALRGEGTIQNFVATRGE